MEGLSKPIGEDNIGNSLLKKMGWDGGALGQRGDGILEPIDIHIKRDNKGIGHDHKDNEEVHTSMSFVLLDGLILAAAHISPVNSSVANNIFSIS